MTLVFNKGTPQDYYESESNARIVSPLDNYPECIVEHMSYIENPNNVNEVVWKAGNSGEFVNTSLQVLDYKQYINLLNTWLNQQ